MITKRDIGTVSEDEINEAFQRTHFGTEKSNREILSQGVLERQAGYHTGWTITQIMVELGLLTKRKNVTKKGRCFLFVEFSDKRFVKVQS